MKNENGKMTRTIIVALCALVFIGAVAKGTMAYFTYTPDPTVNTFVAGDILKDDDEFVLMEHKALDDDGDGEFELGDDEVLENEYAVIPGIDIPKDPFVKTGEALEHSAYVFIEVVDELTDNDALTYEVDSDNWIELTGVIGSHGGIVYKYKELAAKDEVLGPVYILDENSDGNTITVATDKALPDDGNIGKLSFYGYMIQAAGFDSAEDAWEGF